jgi:hypothetical protein
VFRGGGDLTPKYYLGEVKIKNGKVQPTRGISLELVPRMPQDMECLIE